ncbi:MAG: ABC transporter ATP-binding protein [Hyphomonadaceae bacterium]|nr:ABC transporter ATP-binding protein [Hyphomonadaceae bacterium]
MLAPLASRHFRRNSDRSAELRLEKISKRFGGLKVFQDVSFTLPPGDVLGIIGPNGAGKTTLINIICGNLAPTTGRILLQDVDITGKSIHMLSRRGLVRTFQQTNAFARATVRDSVARAFRFSGNSANGTDVTSLLRRFDLLDRLDEPTGMLPYGQQKMLGLLLAYATRPKVLLLDEPAAGLEARERSRIDDFVHHARRAFGCAILIVEHDMDLIRRLCPRILVLDGGRVLAEGAPQDVLSRQDVIEAYLGGSDETATVPC